MKNLLPLVKFDCLKSLTGFGESIDPELNSAAHQYRHSTLKESLVRNFESRILSS